MNKLNGAVLIVIVCLFAFLLVHKDTVNTIEKKKSIIPDISSPGLIYNGITLVDRTVINETSNVCTAQNLGMNITISPCVADDVDGRDIEQYVNFGWTGASAQNTSWIFVYTGTLDGGSMSVQQNVSYNYTQYITVQQFISNFLVDRITSAINMSPPDSRCQLGNTNNTQMYNVTRNLYNNASLTSTFYCFSSVTVVNATAYRISGNIDSIQPQIVQGTRLQWADVTNQVHYLGSGLLNDNYSYYSVNNVVFNPGQEIKTRWIYTAANHSVRGKWHIVGYNPNEGLTSSIVSGHYIYIDPWWNNGWSYKQTININGTIPSNYSMRMVVPYNVHMLANYSDLRFVNGSENAELPYWIENYTTSNATVWVMVQNNATIFMYYGNPSAAASGNIRNTFEIGDEFNGSALDTLYWNVTAETVPSTWYSVNNGYLSFNSSDSQGRAIKSVKTVSGSHIWVARQYMLATAGSDRQFFGFWGTHSVGDDRGTGGNGSFIYVTDPGQSIVFGYDNIQGSDSPVATSTSPYGAANEALFSESFNTTDSTGCVQNLSVGAPMCASKLPGAGETVVSQNANLPYVMTGRGTNPMGYFVNYIYVYKWLAIPPSPGFGTETANTGLSVTQIRPNSGLVTSQTVQSLACDVNVTGSTTITNATLYVWNSTNVTIFSNVNTSVNGFNSTSLNWTIQALTDGSYYWQCFAGGSAGEMSATGNRSFSIDSTLPQISITAPANGTSYLVNTIPTNVTFNVSIIELNPSTCWFNNETGQNTSFSCTNSNFSLAFGEGNHRGTANINDSVGFTVANSTLFFINLYNYSVGYPPTNLVGLNTTISFNVTATNTTGIVANLTYNNTVYPFIVTSNNGTFVTFNVSATSPTLASSANVPFYINFSWLTYNIGTGVFNQLVNTPQNATVGNCASPSLVFTLYDEENLSRLNGTFNYDFSYGFSNASLIRSYGQITNFNSFGLCVNTTLAPTWYMGSGMVFYSSTSYVDRRYYTFTNMSLTNQTTNISLYDLLTASQTSFQLTVEDTSLNPYVAKFTTLVRWYPNLNQYNVVDMGLTDGTGSTVIHVKAEDVDYRIGVYEQNGTLIRLADPIRMVCTSSPCTYTLKISPTDTDYTSFLGIQYTLDFNYTTNVWSFVYSDPSQRTNTMNLTIYRDTAQSSRVICTSTSTGYVGAISCNTTGYTGNLRAVVSRVASPPVVFTSKLVDIINSEFGSKFGLWISFLLGLPIICILLIMSPIAAIIGGIIALLPAYYFGAIGALVMGAVAIIGGIIAHFLTRS